MVDAARKIEPQHPYDVVCVAIDDRDEWLRARRTGIGASEIAVVLGLSRWKSALELYVQKTGQAEPEDISDEEPVLWGTVLEGVVAEQYGTRRYAGRRVRLSGELLRSVEHPWALATLDAWCEHPEHGEIPLEIKTTGAHKAEEWAEGPPEPYLAQLHQQMLVTGAPAGSIACLIGGQRLVWCDVERDETLIRRIVYAGRDFWFRVEQRQPPEPDASESAKRAIAALFPADAGTTITLPGEMRELDERLCELKERRRELDAEITRAENAIKLAIGPNARGVLPGGDVAYSWITQERRAYTVEAMKARVLRRHQSKNGR